MKNEIIEVDYNSLIYNIRGMKVMIDSDLANLYWVETKRLKESVRRNPERFPEDFMFVLTNEEVRILRSQIASSSWGGSRYGNMVFTEQGVAMLSSVLNSKRAILVNIRIIYSHSLGFLRTNPSLFFISESNWHSASFFLPIVIDPLATNEIEELCLFGGNATKTLFFGKYS
jgi:hypothetical protein